LKINHNRTKIITFLNINALNNSISQLPRHIAIIMDGNGRWAKQRFLPRFAGHQAGLETVRRVVKLATTARRSQFIDAVIHHCAAT
jgi:undecaprenyl pyrophosphate synthase